MAQLRLNDHTSGSARIKRMAGIFNFICTRVVAGEWKERLPGVEVRVDDEGGVRHFIESMFAIPWLESDLGEFIDLGAGK
jgi:hypothetical protein